MSYKLTLEKERLADMVKVEVLKGDAKYALTARRKIRESRINRLDDNAELLYSLFRFVCDKTGYKASTIRSKSRKNEIVFVRRLFISIAKDLYPNIKSVEVADFLEIKQLCSIKLAIDTVNLTKTNRESKIKILSEYLDMLKRVYK